MQRAAAECYLPMNDLLLELIKSTGGRLRVSFYISGTALEQMRSYAPDVLRGFRKLAATGCAEFVGGTYSYSLAALAGREEFTAEVQRHAEMIREEFGQTPDAFFNTAMLYSDSIGETVASLGYKTMLAEGAKHLLGWKSPQLRLCGCHEPETASVAAQLPPERRFGVPLLRPQVVGMAADGRQVPRMDSG